MLAFSLGILPFLHYQFHLKENLEYAIISFVLTAFISAYHLSIMIRTKKRKTDREPTETQTETVHWFKNRAFSVQAIFILIVFYKVFSIAALALALRNVSLVAISSLPLVRMFPYLTSTSLPYVCIGYSMISFALAALISAHHLSTMIRRRKRKTDQAAG
jgi:membrane protein implicated in regulation of membrane protease activity